MTKKIQFSTRKITDLKPSEYNPRRITKAEMSRLKESIKTFGFVNPVIVNIHKDRKDIIIGGHQRIDAAKELGITEVPVIEVKFSLKKEKLLNLALNKIRGRWDEKKLASVILNLYEENEDMYLTGFTDREIDHLISNMLKNKDDKIPLLKKEDVKVKLGDIWQLGRHKIMCGDATKKENLNNLIDKDLVDLVLTDPPYNLGIDYNSPLVDDAKIPKEYKNWCKRWFKLCKEKADKILITSGIWNIPMWFEIEKPRWILTWYRKNSQSRSLLKGFTHWEPILLYHKHEQIFFYGNIDKVIPSDVYKADLTAIDDVYDINTAFYEDAGTEGIAADHPCPKPVKLWASLIKDFTRANNIVLDIFLGSGTAIIACERVNRVCYGIELDPYYCQISINRWEAYTGEKATRIIEGSTEMARNGTVLKNE